MTQRDFIPDNDGALDPDLIDAPHSWDPAGRNVPAAKLDWTECLQFSQVRGVEVALAPDQQDPDDPAGLIPEPGDPGDSLQ